MKIGILGGTLDPIHNGHIEIALAAMKALKLDRVALLPSGNPPHKKGTADRRDRLRMAELAAREHPGLYASDVEIVRSGPTYTVDTLSALVVESPDVAWTYIVGADTLNTLDTWREFPRVARLCSFAVINRPGCDEDLIRLRAKAISTCYGTRVELLPVTGPALSSTQIRRQVAEGEDITGQVPMAVADYIRRRGMYLCDYDEPQILERLQKLQPARRYAHTLGVADTAQRLSIRFGVDPMRARLAGLLHDCAKYMPLDEMRALIVERMPDLDESELEPKAIRHAPAGMILARDDFGVRDPAILSAIRKHTVGDGEMSAMDALIYVADFIEPGREPFPGLDKVRALAERDIYKAMVLSAELSVKHVRERGQPIHPKTLRLLERYGN